MNIWRSILLSLPLAMLLIACNVEQEPQAINVFDKYGPLDEFNLLNFHPSVFLIIEDKKHADLQETIKKLNDVKIIKHEISSEHSELTKEFLIDLKHNFPRDSYKDLMVVKEGKERVIFKIRENDKIVEELVMQMFDENSITIAMLSGEIDIEKVSDLAAKFNVSELESLDILKN